MALFQFNQDLTDLNIVADLHGNAFDRACLGGLDLDNGFFHFYRHQSIADSQDVADGDKDLMDAAGIAGAG